MLFSGFVVSLGFGLVWARLDRPKTDQAGSCSGLAIFGLGWFAALGLVQALRVPGLLQAAGFRRGKR